MKRLLRLIAAFSVVLGLLCSAGCFVDSTGVPDGHSRVYMSLPTDKVGQGGGAEDTALPYALGLYISISGEGMPTPVTITRTWVTGAVIPAQVNITKDVPAGDQRRFEAHAFMQDDEEDAGYTAWTLDDAVKADLPEGEEISVDLTLHQPGFGGVDLNLGAPELSGDVYLAFEHPDSGLRIPAVECIPPQCAHESVPVGLPMMPVLILEDGSEESYPAKKITLDREGARVTVSIIRE